MSAKFQHNEPSKSAQRLVRYWYQRRLAAPLWLLTPFSALFTVLAAVRRGLFFIRLKRTYKASVPVVVVGNVTVGGTGKTPTVLGLVRVLQQAGYSPGIVSRGYGGTGPFPLLVTAASKPQVCGDEPVMLAQLSGVPVAVAPRRADAVRLLLAEKQVDIVIADDGLQHYALGRDIEIAVVDGERGLGNGWRLPAGPLRESARRLRKVDWVIVNGAEFTTVGQYGERLKLSPQQRSAKMIAMQLQPTGWHRVTDHKEIDTPTGENALAIAGIGNPERFFKVVMDQAIDLQETRVFPDHYQYVANDFYNVSNSTPILMTEKDAVKCADFARPHWYYLKVVARFSNHFEAQFLARVAELSAPTADTSNQHVQTSSEGVVK